MLTPSSLACARSSGGVVALGVRLLGGGADLLAGEVADRLLEHLLLVVGGEVEQVARPAGLLAGRFAELLRGLEGARRPRSPSGTRPWSS